MVVFWQLNMFSNLSGSLSKYMDYTNCEVCTSLSESCNWHTGIHYHIRRHTSKERQRIRCPMAPVWFLCCQPLYFLYIVGTTWLPKVREPWRVTEDDQRLLAFLACINWSGWFSWCFLSSIKYLVILHFNDA